VSDFWIPLLRRYLATRGSQRHNILFLLIDELLMLPGEEDVWMFNSIEKMLLVFNGIRLKNEGHDWQ
jgi:hypothetical protein